MWREKLETESRAKIFWGDSAEDVQAYMRSQGFTEQEAREAVTEMVQDRMQSVRSLGRRNILIGVPLALVPVGAFIVFSEMHLFPLKLFAATVAVGLFGCYKIVRGIVMQVAPGSISGDLSDPAET